MHGWPDELRLLATLVANALVVAASWRIARRFNPRVVVALPDALLLWLATQYVVTGVCGIVGALRPDVFLGVASAISLAALFWSPSPPGSGVRGEGACRLRATSRPDSSPRIASPSDEAPSPQPSPGGRGNQIEDRVVWAAFAFVLAYAATLLFNQRSVPTLATDPLVYHLPAAAQWLQAGRIGLVDFVYWLPASSHSPLAGSVWIAWWLGPLGNDALARFVQLPTWLLLFAATLRLLRDVRVPTIVAAISAVSVVVARPFVSQMTIPKDDIAVAALAIVLLGGIHPRRLRERFAVARLGVAFGLMLSVKYPAPLALPTLVPAILLMRWRTLGLRGVLAANAIAFALVAPWLARNVLYTGNPVYPFFAGNAGFIADPLLTTPAGIYTMLASSFHSLPLAMWIAWLIAAIVLVARGGRSLLRDNVRIALLVGPPLAIVVLIVGCPFPEIRYLFTAIAALLAMIAVAIACVPWRRAQVALASVVLIVSLATSFDPSWLTAMAGFVGVGLIGSLVARMLATCCARSRRIVFVAGSTATMLAIYVWWPAFLRHSDNGYAHVTDEAWIAQYGDVGRAWAMLRANVPAGSTIAYANTPSTWPLFGFDLRNHVVYAPTRPGLTHLCDLPPVRERIPARDEYLVYTRLLNDGADAMTWLANLERLHVDYIYCAKADASPDPPELRFAREHADRFAPMFENDAAIVWRFKP